MMSSLSPLILTAKDLEKVLQESREKQQTIIQKPSTMKKIPNVPPSKFINKDDITLIRLQQRCSSKRRFENGVSPGIHNIDKNRFKNSSLLNDAPWMNPELLGFEQVQKGQIFGFDSLTNFVKSFGEKRMPLLIDMMKSEQYEMVNILLENAITTPAAEECGLYQFTTTQFALVDNEINEQVRKALINV